MEGTGGAGGGAIHIITTWFNNEGIISVEGESPQPDINNVIPGGGSGGSVLFFSFVYIPFLLFFILFYNFL